MSLLDALNDPTISRGLLEFGLRLMSTPGKAGQAIGQSGLGALQGMSQYKNQEFQDALRKHQLAQMQRENALAELPGKFVTPGQTGVDATGGTETATTNPANFTPPSMDLKALAQAYMAAPGGFNAGMNLQQALVKEDPLVKGTPGDVFFDKSGRQRFSVPALPEKEPEQIRLLKQIYGDGTPAYEKAKLLLGEKQVSHPPGTTIKIDNKLGEGLAKEVGPMIADSAQQAQGAQQQISNADSLIKAIDSNKVMAGPGATIRLKGAQIGQMLGVGGKDSAETVTNTRTVIQGLARATVAARSALKGQGQVSDFEGKLLAKAESGDIDDMTTSEIKQIAVVNKRLATQMVERHKTLIRKAKSNKATAAAADFFDVPDQTQVIDFGSLPNGR